MPPEKLAVSIAAMKYALTIALFCLFVNACSRGYKVPTDESWTLRPIVKVDDRNPILEPDDKSTFFCPVRKKNVRWEEKDVFNPAAVMKDNGVWLLYRAQDKLGQPGGTSRIGLAKSRDGLIFRRTSLPVLYPDNDPMKIYEWEGGCEDPRIVRRDDGTYLMTYTAYDGKIARLCVASSPDLIAWKKHGLAFNDTRYRDLWSKSGAIVSELIKGEIIARKVKGKYWMYWGDTDLFLASSDDGIYWQPLENKKNKLLPVMQPRATFFDSRLVEPGPFALWRKNGILLLYNSANSASSGDKSLAADTYSVGQALFSPVKPEQLIGRAKGYLMTPERDYELTGQVNNVCFLEGMVWFKDRWLLYYGTADSKIAVAECKP